MKVTVDQITQILIGAEMGGNISNTYKASLAVPNAIWGADRSGNSSGITFGAAQLDIGNNKVASGAYTNILTSARFAPVPIVNDENYARLTSHNGVQRPDLQPGLHDTIRSDLKTLTAVFNEPASKAIIDSATKSYLATDVLPKVQNFLSAVRQVWGRETVFESASRRVRFSAPFFCVPPSDHCRS